MQELQPGDRLLMRSGDQWVDFTVTDVTERVDVQVRRGDTHPLTFTYDRDAILTRRAVA